jgi:proteasome lid subunit RPN8/RPN11
MRDALIDHLRAGLPNEGCGLIATHDAGDGTRTCLRFYPGDNVDRSPTRFTMDSHQVLDAIEELEGKGWELGVIIHSHPRTEPSPSKTDLAEAYYLESLFLIVSFAHSEPELRAWRFEAAGAPDLFTEIPIAIAAG